MKFLIQLSLTVVLILPQPAQSQERIASLPISGDLKVIYPARSGDSILMLLRTKGALPPPSKSGKKKGTSPNFKSFWVNSQGGFRKINVPELENLVPHALIPSGEDLLCYAFDNTWGNPRLTILNWNKGDRNF